MTERWVCSRCFTSAEPRAATCPNCGLARGTERPSAFDEVSGPDADTDSDLTPVMTATAPTAERSEAATGPLADLNAARASGGVSEAMYPFEKAKLDLAQTGTRRLFACGRCGEAISLAWKKCDHCRATFDQFPPIDTGKDVPPGHDSIIARLSRIASFFQD